MKSLVDIIGIKKKMNSSINYSQEKFKKLYPFEKRIENINIAKDSLGMNGSMAGQTSLVSVIRKTTFGYC